MKASDPSFDAPGPTEFEQEVLSALEDYELLIERKRASQDALAALLTQAMRDLMPPGTMIQKRDRTKPWSGISPIRGHDYNALTFEIVEISGVDVDKSHPELSNWTGYAWAISKDGKRMNSRTFRDGMVWVKAMICRNWDLSRDRWVEQLMRIMAMADEARAKRELEQALKGE